MAFPKMFRVKQELEGPALHDIPGAVRDTMRSLHLQEKVKPGQTVAITSGSRGVANIDRITRAVVDELKTLGLQPFVCPTMGSHGEATAEGQLKILAHYGITEATMGCPMKSSMEVVEIGKVKGTTVFCDKNAWGADHIVVVGRIKAHTDFDGEIESGLYKMMAIGLGKQHGAENYHRAGHQYSYGEIFPLVGQAVLDSGHVLCGLGIVENGHDQTAKVQAVLPKDFAAVEKALLKEAKVWMARLPFDKLDLLIVDELGKNISGAGMDPNVTGRASVQKPGGKPHIRMLFVRDITPEADGNAIGVGFADMTTKRLVKKINYVAMYMNAITSGVPDAGKVPMAFETDREAIETALGMIGLTPPEQARVVRIKNTLALTEIDCSEALQAEVKKHRRLSPTAEPGPISFGADGNLTAF
ncbi:MAG: lactate racemase domain-containing protein [candidate division NC10 bacterium]|nr:lactate racemase domain-containing protein [candidate division NC10 bacterium]